MGEWAGLVRFVLCGVLLPLLTASVCWGIEYFLVGDGILSEHVVLKPGISLQEWIEGDFFFASVFGAGSAFFCHFLWYAGGSKVSMERLEHGDRRVAWIVLLVVCMVVAAIAGWRASLALQEYAGAVVGVVWLFSTIAFYLASLLFSPVALKYNPPLSYYVRRLLPW